MNKADLVDRVALKLGVSKVQASKCVEAVFESIAEGVRDDERVAIAGFGAFLRREKAGRLGVNPVTQERLEIKPTTTCAFRPAPALKAALAGPVKDAGDGTQSCDED